MCGACLNHFTRRKNSISKIAAPWLSVTFCEVSERIDGRRKVAVRTKKPVVIKTAASLCASNRSTNPIDPTSNEIKITFDSPHHSAMLVLVIEERMNACNIPQNKRLSIVLFASYIFHTFLTVSL